MSQKLPLGIRSVRIAAHNRSHFLKADEVRAEGSSQTLLSELSLERLK